MKKNQPFAIDSVALRRQAEAQLREQQPHLSLPTTEEKTLRLVHELQVHQIELELQNHALLEIRAQLEQSLKKYTDLYDFSPAGYFTLTDDGTIQDVNLAGATLLAMDRSHLIGKRFGLFVADQSRPGFNALLERMRSGATRERCEVAIEGQAAPPCYLHLEGVGLEGETGWQYWVSALDITERKLIEDALHESELRFRKLIEDVPSVAIQGYGPDGMTQYWNQASERLYGYSAAEAIGQNLLDLIIPPEMRTEVTQAMQWMAKTGQGIPSAELSLMRKDGSRVTVFSSHTMVQRPGQPAELFCIDIDLTERKQMEAALRRSEEQYRAVIETSSDGFWVVDRQGRLLEANPAYSRLSGYSRDELLRMAITDLEASETPDQIGAHIEKIIRDGSDLFQTLHRAKSGRIWQVEMNVTYWSIENGRFFAFIRDINRRQRSEALLKIRMQLAEIAQDGSLDDILQMALDAAERFTGSQISFFHLVDPHQEHRSLQTWSTNTRKICTAKDLRYLLDQVGAWADYVGQGQPIIYNDYASLPGKKGLPAGHTSLVRELMTPIQRNQQIVAILGLGNKPENYDDDDLEMIQQLADITMRVIERKSAEELIAHLAYHDALTHLPNRALLNDRLLLAMAKAQRDQKRLAVCYLDLDGFKPINDTWGHAYGDRALIEVAQRLKAGVRAGDTVARLGGDEFVLLLGDLIDLEECEQALDRIMTVLRAPFAVAGQAVQLSASLGATLYPDDDSDPDTLIRHVDQVMYAAKQAGGDRYQLFDAEYDRRARHHHDILQQVQNGLDTGEFRLHYQPKVDMRRGAVIGVEALLLWQRPDQEPLSPDQFMPVIEASEMAVTVGCWVMNEALRQMAVWIAQDFQMPVSVNLSVRHLQQPDFSAQIQALLAKHPAVRPESFELEILETTPPDDLMGISAQIAECQRLGVRFALDDFGTGYSSLSYLRRLPVQLLKIDQSFVRDMLVDSEALAIVQGIINLATTFHRGVIAEGVETVAHGRRLLEMGCTLAQGYAIARAMPPEQIPDWVAGWKPLPAWLNIGDTA